MDTTRKLSATLILCALLLLLAPGARAAGAFGSGSSFVPRVPVSAFGLSQWLDPSRLHLSSTISVGAGGWSGSSSALQVTTLSYQFKAPVAMSVSLGNAWGSNQSRGQSSLFLEGFSVAYQPTRSMFFQVQFQDLRSPLQYGSLGSRGGPFGY
jgi:hypothetical protein